MGFSKVRTRARDWVNLVKMAYFAALQWKNF